MISLEDMKAHLRVTTDVDDAIIADKTAVASEWVSKYTAIPVDSTTIPAPVNEAIRLLVGHLYANREATMSGITSQSMPFGVLEMLDSYRAWSF